MGFDDSCNTGLVLGLGPSPTSNNYNNAIKRSSGYKFDPSLTLSLSGDSSMMVVAGADLLCRQTSSHSGVSSFSTGRVVKRERDGGEESREEEEEMTERVISDYHEDEEGVSARKKLRLTKEQSALLEESFKHHSTLNPKQKQDLARQLNLRPRQVEVWFQNRRARTKLKQTEVDCEFLKKCCETLTNENIRLQKEIQDLKTLKLTHQPFYMHMPAASTLTMCPSCEKIGGRSGGDSGEEVVGSGGSVATTVVVDGGTSKGAFSISSKPHFFNPCTNSSAAC